MKKYLSFILLFSFLVSSAQKDLRRVIDLEGYWKFSIGDNPRWADPKFNDYSWEEIYVPSEWENEGFNGFDGYAWYRITIDLKNVSSENLFLVLGYIDDVDEVYLNGELIGFNGNFPPNFYTAYNSFRQYYIPPELLDTNGKNVIAVRVYDTVLQGGIVKGNIGIYTSRKYEGPQLRLEGIWKFQEGDNPAWKAAEYDDSNWDYTMVPSYWRELKHIEVKEGTAWYRKEFELPENLKSEDELVVVVGLIDDFDETYLNGQLIGYTNDGRGLGPSQSWRQYRIYVLPQKLLNKEGKNVISVRVKDLGGNAGIYAGPLAVVPYNNFRRVID